MTSSVRSKLFSCLLSSKVRSTCSASCLHCMCYSPSNYVCSVITGEKSGGEPQQRSGEEPESRRPLEIHTKKSIFQKKRSKAEPMSALAMEQTPGSNNSSKLFTHRTSALCTTFQFQSRAALGSLCRQPRASQASQRTGLHLMRPVTTHASSWK